MNEKLKKTSGELRNSQSEFLISQKSKFLSISNVPYFINNKKAAIELSMNFLVMVIIAITIFGFGIGFVYTILNNAQSLKDLTTEDLDQRISDLMCKKTQKVCVEKEILVLSQGELEIVGIRILNIEDGGSEMDFKIEMSEGIYIDQDNNVQPITTPIKVMPIVRHETIRLNDMKSMGFGFEIDKYALRGTYVFNLNVTRPDMSKYDNLHKIRIKVI